MLSLPFEALRDSLHWHKSKARELIHLARQKNPTVIMSHTGVYSFNSFILFLLRKELFQGTHSIVYISHFIFHRREKKAFPHMINTAAEHQGSRPRAGFGPSISNLASVIYTVSRGEHHEQIMAAPWSEQLTDLM